MRQTATPHQIMFLIIPYRLGWGSSLHNLVIGPSQWLSYVVNMQDVNYNSCSAFLHTEEKKRKKDDEDDYLA